jgi:hypothetical protein
MDSWDSCSITLFEESGQLGRCLVHPLSLTHCSWSAIASWPLPFNPESLHFHSAVDKDGDGESEYSDLPCSNKIFSVHAFSLMTCFRLVVLRLCGSHESTCHELFCIMAVTVKEPICFQSAPMTRMMELLFDCIVLQASYTPPPWTMAVSEIEFYDIMKHNEG